MLCFIDDIGKLIKMRAGTGIQFECESIRKENKIQYGMVRHLS
jgi:hypothetical protein